MTIETRELSSELVDWLTETVVLPSDPQRRADRICAVVEALVEAIDWRGPSNAVELVSVAAILQAARAHQEQMRTTTPALVASDPRLSDLG